MKIDIEADYGDICNLLESLEEFYHDYKNLGPGTKAASAKKIHNQLIDENPDFNEFEKIGVKGNETAEEGDSN